MHKQRSNNYVAPSKQECFGIKDGNELSIVIPAAGLGRRMKLDRPKTLVDIGIGKGCTILERQLQLLYTRFPKVDIVVVGGYEIDKLREFKSTKDYRFRLVYNNEYDTTNVGYSIGLGMQACSTDTVLIVYGDLIFNERAINIASNKVSQIIIDNQQQMNNDEVGVVANKEIVTNLSYGIRQKWCQMVCLNRKEKELMEKISLQENTRRYFGYEIINSVIKEGGVFEIREPPKMIIAEIDTPKDLKKLSKF